MSFAKRQSLPRPQAIGLEQKLAELGSGERRVPLIVLLQQTLDQALDGCLRHLSPEQQARLMVYAAQGAPARWPQDLRLAVVARDEIASAQGCLCCAMGSEFAQSLGQLFFKMLRKEVAPVKAVLVVTEADQAEVLAQTLAHAPFLGQRYYLAACLLPTRA